MVAGSWAIGSWPNSPRGKGVIIAYSDGLRFDAGGSSRANFELPWDKLESYGSQDYAVEFRLNTKPPWFSIIIVKPGNMMEKQAWLDLLESKQVPKAQRQATAHLASDRRGARRAAGTRRRPLR